MNRLFFLAVCAVCLLAACKKAEEYRYESNDGVYLDFGGGDRDSILYSFAYNPGVAKDTILIPVRISGIRTDTTVAEDRKFILKAELDSSSAKENIHFKPLDPFYYIKKGTGYTEVPVVIYNTDPQLESSSVTLHIRLYPTEYFQVNNPKLIFGKIVFSNKLERPSWWGMWFADYYSRAKHEIFLITTGLTEMSTNGLDAPKNLYFVSLVNTFLADPAKWISKNPARGYKLDLRSDGNFDFYNEATPNKKLLYKKNEQANKFYFIDEEGKEVK